MAVLTVIVLMMSVLFTNGAAALDCFECVGTQAQPASGSYPHKVARTKCQYSDSCVAQKVNETASTEQAVCFTAVTYHRGRPVSCITGGGTLQSIKTRLESLKTSQVQYPAEFPLNECVQSKDSEEIGIEVCACNHDGCNDPVRRPTPGLQQARNKKDAKKISESTHLVSNQEKQKPKGNSKKSAASPKHANMKPNAQPSTQQRPAHKDGHEKSNQEDPVGKMPASFIISYAPLPKPPVRQEAPQITTSQTTTDTTYPTQEATSAEGYSASASWNNYWDSHHWIWNDDYESGNDTTESTEYPMSTSFSNDTLSYSDVSMTTDYPNGTWSEMSSSEEATNPTTISYNELDDNAKPANPVNPGKPGRFLKPVAPTGNTALNSTSNNTFSNKLVPDNFKQDEAKNNPGILSNQISGNIINAPIIISETKDDGSSGNEVASSSNGTTTTLDPLPMAVKEALSNQAEALVRDIPKNLLNGAPSGSSASWLFATIVTLLASVM